MPIPSLLGSLAGPLFGLVDELFTLCLLYTPDADDELPVVDLRGRRIA